LIQLPAGQVANSPFTFGATLYIHPVYLSQDLPLIGQTYKITNFGALGPKSHTLALAGMDIGFAVLCKIS